jgi:tRNA pseudouridine38-40 synthase
MSVRPGDPIPPPAPDAENHAVLLVEYDGGPFKGWARQPDAISIEAEFHRALGLCHARDITLRCAGRTDAGVHAVSQVVGVAYDGPVPPENLAAALRQPLHPGVSVIRSAACPPTFDARAHARARAYEYRVLCRPARSPLRAARVLHHPRALDWDLLCEAAAAVEGQHDFTAFTPHESAHKYFRRTVLESRWERRDDELVYTIRANAFLRHMVRVIMGSMLAVGRHDWPLDAFTALLAGAPRAEARQTAAPHALCLIDVEYDEESGLPPGWVR